jgi:hypothetical protein
MKTNPGGQIAIENILGRDEFIDDLWAILDQQSVIMTAERRIGKTSIIRKMAAQPAKDWIPVLQDLEDVHSAREFATVVYEKITLFLTTMQKVAERAKKLWNAIGGTEIAGVFKLPDSKEQHWKPLLSHAIEDLAEKQAPKRLVFFWDELPYMLDNIRKHEGEATAIEILDVLRALRQKHAGFRIVLTGSIGLHHVLTRLKEADYKNEPLNDMYGVEVTPLGDEHARELAANLIEGEQIESSNLARVVAKIAREGDCFPFYIHHIVRCLKTSGRKATPKVVADVVSDQLTDANDPWELEHYRTRIRDYYPKEEDVVLALLDALAVQKVPSSLADLFAAVKSQLSFDDRNRLQELLRLLERDHYLKRAKDGNYHFRFPLIQRWWKLDRGLNA